MGHYVKNILPYCFILLSRVVTRPIAGATIVLSRELFGLARGVRQAGQIPGRFQAALHTPPGARRN
jgi:hypothetical protein